MHHTYRGGRRGPLSKVAELVIGTSEGLTLKPVSVLRLRAEPTDFHDQDSSTSLLSTKQLTAGARAASGGRGPPLVLHMELSTQPMDMG